jgi:hypothetical protein
MNTDVQLRPSQAEKPTVRSGRAKTVDIRRAKNGTPGIHGLQGDELRLLRELRREHPHADFVFLSERKAPLSIDEVQKLI